MKPIRLIAFATLPVLALALSARADNPLPSWNDGAAKQSIVDYTTKVPCVEPTKSAKVFEPTVIGSQEPPRCNFNPNKTKV